MTDDGMPGCLTYVAVAVVGLLLNVVFWGGLVLLTVWAVKNFG